MPKNPHAVALGRLGGHRNSPAQQAAKRRNGLLGGRPRAYRLTAGLLERRDGDRWLTLEPPYPRAAQAALRRLRSLPAAASRPAVTRG